MKRMIWTSVVMAALLGSGTALAASDRNVLLMIGDDHGLELGCYGHPAIQTPSLDRLAGQGTRFAQAFATVSSCSPSRSTIYSGQYNHTNGMYGLAHAAHNFSSVENAPSIFKSLKNAGYRVALIGKDHVKPESVYPFERLPCPGSPRNVIEMAESAEKFLDEVRDQPFLLVVGFTDPHRDWGNDKTYKGVKEVQYKPGDVVVPPFLSDTPEVREELAEYCQSVSRMDQGIGAMLDALKRSGHADDTLVIYVSDNGMPFPGAKTNLYDPGVHLPMLISSPKQDRHGNVCNAMVSFVDLAPTVLDWAGVKKPGKMPGRSMLPILDEENPAGWDTIFGSHTFHEVTMYYPMRMIRMRQYKYILNLAHELEFPTAGDLWGGKTWQGVLARHDERFGQRSIAAYLHRPHEELYDLKADPNETHNLAEDPALAGVLADMRKQLREWQERTNDPWAIKYKHE